MGELIIRQWLLQRPRALAGARTSETTKLAIFGGACLWESVGDHKAISKVSFKTALRPSWPHKLFQAQADSDQSSVLRTRPLGGFERPPLRRAWRLRIAAVAS
jgi:hypothetical protein